MTNKTIIEKAFDELWVRFCTNQAEYKDIKNFFLTQLTLAEKRGEEKAILAIRKDYEFHIENQYEHIVGLQEAIWRMFNRVLKQSQERKEK